MLSAVFSPSSMFVAYLGLLRSGLSRSSDAVLWSLPFGLVISLCSIKVWVIAQGIF